MNPYEQEFMNQVQQATEAKGGGAAGAAGMSPANMAPMNGAPEASGKRRALVILGIIVGIMALAAIILSAVWTNRQSDAEIDDDSAPQEIVIAEPEIVNNYDAPDDGAEVNDEMVGAEVSEAAIAEKTREFLKDPVVAAAPYSDPEGRFEVDAWGTDATIEVVLMPSCADGEEKYEEYTQAGLLWIALQNENAVQDYTLTITTCE